MRPLVFFTLALAAALAFFFTSGAPFAPLDPLASEIHGPAESELPPQPNDLTGIRTQAARQVAEVPTDGVPSAAPSPAEPIPMATITVTVRFRGTPEERPSFEGLRVEASSLRSGQRFDGALVLADGTAEISVAGGGRYRVSVDPESVPEGFVASGEFRLGALDQSGVAGAFVEVEDEQTAPCELTIFKTTFLKGLVTGPEGTPLDGVTVRAQGLAPGMAGLSHDDVTSESGEFEIHGLLPLVYGVNVVDTGTHADSLDDVPHSPKQLFDLKLGSYEGAHLALGGGRVTLAGSVVDELGEAFADVSVRAYYVGDEAHGVAMDFERVYDWSDHAFTTRTDAQGKYRVRGVAGVPLRIQVGADEAANGPSRRAKFVPEPVEVALDSRSHGSVEAGPVELVRSRRFTVKGRVELAKAEHPDLRLRHSRVELQVSPYGRVETTVKRPGLEAQPHVEYSKSTGVFTLSCETPLDECTLTLTLRGHPEMNKEFHFLPEPDRTLEDQVLSFP